MPMRRRCKTLDYSVLQQCMHCGMCLPTCPTYDATGRERNSPRGRIALMRAIADGELEVTPTFADEMSYCLGCLACQTACPAGVNYATLFETARERHPGGGRRCQHAATLLARGRAAIPVHAAGGASRTAGRLLRVYQRSGLEAWSRRSALTRLLPAGSPPARAAGAARLRRDFPTADCRHEAPPGAARFRVALLTGCVQDLVFPDINRDTADVLLANGCAVETPCLQPCCGSLHAHNGEMDLARTLARRMIDLIPPDRYDAIITNAGGCGSHLRHYAPLLADDPAYRERARLWDRKVRDIQEWLVEIGCRRPARRPATRSGRGDLPRVVSPGARPEDLPPAARAAAAAARASRCPSWPSPPGAAAAPASTR